MKLAFALLPLAGCFLFRTDDAERCQPGRTVVLGTQDEVTAFAGCKHASGLTIRTGATIDLSPLRELEAITGDLVIGPTVGIDEAALNGLITVGGAVRVAKNPSLHGLFLPRLVEAGRVAIDGNHALTTIALPRIASVKGTLIITDSPALELLTADQLVTIGHELVILDAPKLALVQLSRLVSVEAVRVERDPKLAVELVAQWKQKAVTP
jgi:hypothetical protein